MMVLVSERESWKTGNQAEMEEERIIHVDVSHVRWSLDFYLMSSGYFSIWVWSAEQRSLGINVKFYISFYYLWDNIICRENIDKQKRQCKT